METKHDTSAINIVLKKARQVGTPEFDVGSLMGLHRPAYIKVLDLHTVMLDHPEPTVSFHWDGDKELAVKRLDGGVLATFKMRF